MQSPPDRTTFSSLVLILLIAAGVGGCGGRGPKKSDGGMDALSTSDGAGDTSVDLAADRVDAAVERADVAETVDAVDAVDAGPPLPVCVSRSGEAPACGAAMCGNGKRESCTVTACTDGTISFPTEACDGTDVAGATCAAEGWGSGSVTCSSTCALVKTACTVCAAVDTTLLACNSTPFPAQRADLLRVAATDTSVAVAWSGVPSNNRLTLSVARLSPTLDLVGVTTLEDASVVPGTGASFTSVSIAPLGTGWIVAAIADQKTVIFHIVDAAGVDKGRVVLDTVDPDSTVASPPFVTIVARPTGGVMALWSATNSIASATIDAAGTRISRPPLSLAALVNVFPSNAVWFDDAAYLIHTASDEASATMNRTVLVRFPADGTAPSSVTLLNQLSQPIAFAADADDLLFLYLGRVPGAADDDPAGLLLRRYDGKGVATAAPVALPSRGSATLLSSGDDALMVGLELGRTLDLQRLARAGTAVTPARTIARFPLAMPIVYFSAARRGAEVVTAWSDTRSGANSIGVARLAQ